ncbi:hypothetical protein CDV31_014931 [Fusarium ambrosium]|uniref:Uncharacterized protein n=1 Tax=Fusarium ambrosium TaxID=131363 RepID=A0A428STD1_9HYPO|nr:hypothetical protein CDV31_014931 [Fusarium ambrosium]
MPMNFIGTTPDGELAAAVFSKDVLVQNLRANMLIGTDCMVRERFDIRLSKGYADIHSCNVRIRLAAWHRQKPTRTTVRAKRDTIVPPNSHAFIPVTHKTTTNQDYLFEPRTDQNLVSHAQMADNAMTHAMFANNATRDIRDSRNTILGHLHSMAADAEAWIVEAESIPDAEALAQAEQPRAEK